MRDAFNNKFQSHYSYATIYYFINKTAYSGIVRYNSKGEYNVPFGRYKNLNTSPIDKSHIELLKSAKLYNKDYSEIFNMAGKDDFMFLDPPYDCVFSDYGNQKYKNGFPEEEHKRLANDFRNLPCKALMIIGKTPLIEDLYRPYIKEEYAKSYAINIKNRFSTDTTHLIVANYESKEGGLLI
jgi:DNA adenine methylase